MNAMVPLALFGWIPAGLTLFLMLPVRKAIITAYVVGWLFLPQAEYPIQGLPDYTRMTAVNLVVLLGVVLFEPQRLLSTRPRIWDLPMLVWCVSYLPTAMLNHLGVYEGLSGIVEAVLTWGVPYWIGRMFFSDRQSIRMLAMGVFIGGLIYVPLCLFEIRMSPQLHRMVYGYHHAWGGVRLGGYRPAVFLNTGIELGLWMAATALVGFWLWRTNAVKRLAGCGMAWLAIALLVTAVMCKSLGALAIAAAALATLLATKYLRVRVAMLVLFLAPGAYVCLRAPQVWYPETFVKVAEWISPQRAVSFESRLHQEEVLVDKAWQRPTWGWGGYGRNRVYTETGKSETVTDSLWIIIFGIQGLVGLVSLGLVFALPALLLWRQLKTHEWWAPATAPAAVLAVCIAMYAIDCLMNAMLNPVYHVMMGAVLGYALTLASQPQAMRARSGRSMIWQKSPAVSGTCVPGAVRNLRYP